MWLGQPSAGPASSIRFLSQLPISIPKWRQKPGITSCTSAESSRPIPCSVLPRAKPIPDARLSVSPSPASTSVSGRPEAPSWRPWRSLANGDSMSRRNRWASSIAMITGPGKPGLADQLRTQPTNAVRPWGGRVPLKAGFQVAAQAGHRATQHCHRHSVSAGTGQGSRRPHPD